MPTVSSMLATLNKKLRKPEQFLFVGAVVVVLTASFLSRILWLTTFPPGLDQDEAVNGYDAYTLGINGRDHRGNSWPLLLQAFDDWPPVLLTYVTVPFVKVLGLSVTTIRLVVALFGCASVVAMYFLGRRVGLSRWFALLATLILGLAGWSIYLSHFAIPPSLVPFFVCAFLVVFFAWLELPKSLSWKQRLLWGGGVGLVASLLTHAYSTMNLHIPVFLAGAGILVWLVRPHLRLSYFMIWIVYLLVAGPMLWITITQPQKYNARFNEITIMGRPNVVGNFKRNYLQYLSYRYFFGEGNKHPMYQMPGVPLFPLVLAVPFLVGIGALFYRTGLGTKHFLGHRPVHFTELQALLLLFWIVLSPVSPALARDSYHFLRSVHLLPVVVVVMAIGAERLYALLTKAVHKQLALDMMGLIVLINVAVFLAYLRQATGRYPDQLRRYFNDDLGASMRALLEEERCTSRVVTLQITQPYIFYLFYAQRKPDQQLYESLDKRIKIWDMRTTTPEQVDDIQFASVKKEDLQGMMTVYRPIKGVPYSVYLSAEGKCVLFRDF